MLMALLPLVSWGEDPVGAVKKPKILLAGDSLVTEYPESAAPQTGWGQCLAEALGGNVQVRNHAIGGESTKSFIDEGKWDAVLAETRRGDIVMIQFMHNDQKKQSASHYADAATDYKDNLTRFILDVRAKGGVPVLVTGALRRYFHSNGLPQRTLGDYPAAMREVAQATGTPLIDCEQWSYEWLSQLGPEGSVPYYVMDKRNPEAMDNSHLTRDGAQVLARKIAQDLRDLEIWTY